MSIIDSAISSNLSLLKELHNAEEKGDSLREREILLKLAQNYYNKGDFYKAEIFLKRVHKKFPKLYNLYYYFALIYIGMGDISKSVYMLKRELDLFPNNHDAKELLSKLESFSNFPFGTLFIIFLNLVFFVIFNLFVGLDKVLLVKFGFSYWNFSPFSLFSSIFFHYNFIHLFLNLFVLSIFGAILERKVGTWRFLVIFLFSALLGNLCQLIFSFSDNLIVLGASGGLFGVFGALMIKEPLLDIDIFGFLRVPIIFVLSILLLFSFILFFLELDGLSIGNLSHIVGIFTGILIVSLMYPSESSTFYNWIFIIFSIFLIYFGLFVIFSFFFGGVVSFLSFLKSLILGLILVFFGLVLSFYLYFSLKEKFMFK